MSRDLPDRARFYQYMRQELPNFTCTLPTDEQIALMFRALADHTAIMQALHFDPDPTSPWPQATSLGRWYLAMRDAFKDWKSQK